MKLDKIWPLLPRSCAPCGSVAHTHDGTQFLALLVSLSMKLNTCYFQAAPLSLKKIGNYSKSLEGLAYNVCKSGRSLTSKPTDVVTAGQVGQVSLESNYPKFSAREQGSPRHER